MTRLPLRLARREVRRRPGRTALVALLVALPVTGMALAITLIRTDAETPLEEWERRHGQADAVGYISDAELVGLPEGSREVAVVSTHARVKVDQDTRIGVELSDPPLDDPITQGIYDLVAGREPATVGEVALSARLADDLGVEVGDELDWARPAITATVVGEVEPVGCLSCDTALFAPGHLPAPALSGVPAPESAVLLIDLPDGMTQAQLTALFGPNGGNLQVRDLQVQPISGAGDGRGEAVRWSLVIGALVLTVVGIVISAAFAVGARRQLVTIGQLSASGASPATIRTALVLQGTVTGVVGAAFGLVLAAVLLVAGQPLVERLLDERIHGYAVRLPEVAAVVLIGVGAATLAALIPARTAARVPTLAALAGRRPLAPVSRRLVSWGVASMIGGLSLQFLAVVGSNSGSSGDLWAIVAILGGVAELLGACAIAPALVSRLEPLAHRLHGSLRLGARSLARHRARTGAVVSAVAAAGALAVAAGGLMLGTEAQNGIELGVPDDVLVVQSYGEDGTPRELSTEIRTSLGEALPDADAMPLVALRTSAEPAPLGSNPWQVAPAALESPDPQVIDRPTWDSALLADDALLDALRVGDDVREGLEDVGVVVLTSTGNGAEMEGDAVVTLPDGRTTPALAVPHRYTPGYASGLLVSEATADDLGLLEQQIGTVLLNPTPFTGAERAAIEDVQYEEIEIKSTTDSYTSLQWSSPDSGPSPFQLELILSGVALLFSLFVVGVSLALAAAESKDERDVLTIAGAPPGLLARTAAARAWLLALIGAAMAVPVGFLPVVVFARAQAQDQTGGVFDDGFPLVFPTRTVLLLVLVVPVVVALVSWTSSASAQRLRPVRVSTATFE